LSIPLQVFPVARFGPEDCVDLVKQQGRMKVGNRTEQRGIRNVRRLKRRADQEFQQFQEPRLARSLFRACDPEVGGRVGRFHRVRVRDPERERDPLLIRQDDETA
jgi:hypothetical protein